MVTNTDSGEYKSYDTKGKVVKTSTIGGKAGKQIKVTEVSLYAASGKDGIKATVTVSINGTAYAVWIVDSTDYGSVRTYNKYPSLVDVGKDAVLSWTLTTADKRYPVKIKQPLYIFEYIDAEGTTEETPAETPDKTTTAETIIIVEGLTASDVDAALGNIKTKLDDSKITYGSIYKATGV